MSTDPTVRVLTWDWRESPDIEDLAPALAEVSGGRIHTTPVDTGSAEYAVVFSDGPITDAEAAEVYHQRWDGQ